MEQDEDAEKSTGGGGSMLRTLIVGAVFLGVGAGGATVALPLLTGKADKTETALEDGEVEASGDVKETSKDTEKKEAKKKKSDKKASKKKGKGGKEESSILDLEPIVVSLYSDGVGRASVPRLRISVSVDTGDGGYGDGTRQRLRHAFIASMQSLAAEDIRGPQGLDKLTVTLREAAETALGTEVADVFITEFIVL